MGVVFWGSFNVKVSLYEAEQCTEELHMSESTIEAVCPKIVGGKYFRNSFVCSIVSVNALWVWWKCRSNKKYEGIEYNVVDMIKMF